MGSGDAYFTRPMRLTCPDGSRSNSEKLTAVGLIRGGVRVSNLGNIWIEVNPQSVAATSPLSFRSLRISGGTGDEEKQKDVRFR